MNFESYLDDTYFVDQLISALQERVLHGECLFGVYQKSDYRVGVMLPDMERMIDFERQVIEGALKRRGYYAIDTQIADNGLKRDFEW